MRSWSTPTVAQLPPGPAGHLEVFDTATANIESCGPAHGTARMYVCGITPYDATHLGHAFTYVTFDLVNRVWRDLGLHVVYAQNVTDVDDPLLERADDTGQNWKELAAEQVDLFRTDMEALRVIPPDYYVGVVESIGDVVALVQELRDTGHVYQIADAEYPDWYFRSAASGQLGAVAHRDADTMLAQFTEMGGDPERPGKEDPLDCLVWRQERPGEPAWDSPLGRGRPGWHIECTAIALKYLGADFDLQGGGSDLAFPHHEMSAAEAFAATGRPMAKTYVHSAMVGLDGQKMSKSLGNLELVSRLRAQGFDPMAVRLALLAHHYREDWEWSADQLDAAQARLNRWRTALRAAGRADAAALLGRVRGCLRRDLDSPGAIAAVDAWAQDAVNEPGADPRGAALVEATLDALLGLDLTGN